MTAEEARIAMGAADILARRGWKTCSVDHRYGGALQRPVIVVEV